MYNKLTFSVMLSIALVFAGCGSKTDTEPTSKKQSTARLVKVQPAVARTMVARLVLPGTIQAENVANILSTADGKIAEMMVREGDNVETDQVVAKISSLLREDIINSARLLVQAQKEAFAKNPDDPDVKKKLQQAEEDYQFALQQYQQIPVTSPISGVVSKRWVDIGDMIPAKAKLFEIQSGSKLRVDVPVSELDIRQLHVGQAVDITADACPKNIFKGKIQRIHPQINTDTRNGIVEVLLVNPCQNLKSGMFVRAAFITQKIKDAVAIPHTALVHRPQHQSCFVVQDGIAKEVVLQLGLQADGWVQVVSGLTVGDNVVVEGQQQLKTGAAVKIQGTKKTPAAGGAQ